MCEVRLFPRWRFTEACEGGIRKYCYSKWARAQTGLQATASVHTPDWAPLKSGTVVWGLCLSSLGNKERNPRGPSQLLTYNPGRESHTLFPNGHSCMRCFLPLFLSRPCFSQWLGSNNLFYSNDPRFHLILPLQELSASHLAALESPNDWLGKQTVGKTPPGCL